MCKIYGEARRARYENERRVLERVRMLQGEEAQKAAIFPTLLGALDEQQALVTTPVLKPAGGC